MGILARNALSRLPSNSFNIVPTKNTRKVFRFLVFLGGIKWELCQKWINLVVASLILNV